MPLIVDHARRREAIAEIAIDLIAEGGVDNASIRLIAQRAGYSTAIVSHYFRSKAELLEMAFDRTIGESARRIGRAAEDGASLIDALAIFLPADPVATRSWKIWLAFWGLALSDTKYRRKQVARGHEGQAIIRALLERQPRGDATAAAALDDGASRLFALIGGIAVMAIYEPDQWPGERQRAMLAAELRSIGFE